MELALFSRNFKFFQTKFYMELKPENEIKVIGVLLKNQKASKGIKSKIDKTTFIQH